MTPSVYLASHSPRRRTLLQQLGLEFKTIDIAIDEIWDSHETPRDYVTRLALAKAQAGRKILSTGDATPVLGADTAVVVDDDVLGKPKDVDDALAMIERLSGRCHYVYSAVAVSGPIERVKVSANRVLFRPLSAAERRAYVNTEEPYDKAGGYAIQGMAAAFIHRIEGSYSGIMGLPLFETATLLSEAGVSVL